MGRFWKRLFDILFGIILWVIVSPFMLVACLFVFIVSPKSGSPIFRQNRIGRNGKTFKILKLRTMTNEKDLNGKLLPDVQRLKWWGKFIRKTNMDELFQILHIIVGQMSFIGPRPILPNEMLVMTSAEQKIRQSVRPGIIGWESVNESKTNSRYEMAKFDLYYVQNWSLKFDFKILFLSLSEFFHRPDDSYRAPSVTDEEIENAIMREKSER